MNLVRLAILAFIAGSCTAQPNPAPLKTSTNGNTLLWEISGKNLKKPSYLFGTFHLLCKDDIRFSNALKEAVKNTGEVYMEMDMDDPSMVFGAIGLMNMNSGKQLKDLYKPEDYKRVETYFRDSLRSPLTMFKGMKPAFLEALLYPKMMPCKKTSGVEEELMKLAAEDKKEISGFETMAFQASVFDSIPYEDQAKELLKTIDSLESYKLFFDTMVTVYKSQNLAAIEAMFSKSEFGMQENQDILLNNRNKNWITQLRTILKKKNIFIAVGAGHLVGEQGLIALLRKEGYTLRGIENK